MPHEDSKAAYEQLRAAHLECGTGLLEDHVARLDWPHQRIEDYRTAKLRSLLGFARERSPFHAARMADIDPATATIEDLARLPPMAKQEAQEDWDAIITIPDIDRAAPSECWPSSAGSPTRPRDSRCSAQAARVVCAACTYGTGSSS